MSDHHPKFSPSSWPALLQCGHFTSGESGEHADRGARIHALLAAMLNHETITGMRDEVDEAEWSENEIKIYNEGPPTGVEERISYLDDQLNEVYFGTVDCYFAPTANDDLRIFDLKTGQQRDYYPQMAAYALPLMDRYGVDVARAVILYSRDRKTVEYVFTRTDAENELWHVRNNVNKADNGAAPVACDYCQWCAHKGDCPALNNITTGIIKRDILTLPLEEVTQPDQLGELKRLVEYARTQLDAIEDHIKRLAHAGTMPTGYRMGTRAGAVEITDINGAYNVCGLDDVEFMRGCKASYPQLCKEYAKKYGVSEAQARAELDTRLNGYVERKPDVQYLMKAKKEIS